MRYIALDLDKKNAFAGIFDTVSQQTHQERLSLMKDPISLNRFLNSLRPDDILAMEAQPGSFHLYDLCKPRVKQVHVIEAHWLGAILGHAESKTDRNDTGMTLKLERADVLKTVWVPPVEIRDQRALSAHYQELDKDRTRYINRCQALLQDNGLAYEADKLLKDDVYEVVARLGRHLQPHTLRRLASDLRLLRNVETELRLVKAEIQATIQPLREIAVTLPGLDSILVGVALAYIGDVTRFKSPGALTNYTFAPALRSTGGKARHGKLKRRGCSHLRWAMVEAANSAKKGEGPLRVFYLRMLRRKGHDKAIVATARKMLEILWHMLTRNEPYRSVPPAAAERKKQRRDRNTRKARETLQTRPDTHQTIAHNITHVKEVLQMLAH